jgi:aminoglycoside/choline kinase family phosphotransferase
MKEHLPAEFKAALYRWEQKYFFQNCLGRYFKVSESKRKELAVLPALREIARHLASLPRVLVHRDFQSQNIIIQNGQAHLIDFQGMRPGLPHYDLASLLCDPYVDLTEAERSEVIAYYRDRQRENGITIDGDFDLKLRLCAMQRLMQALGAYGFLGLVKGHKHFLQYMPNARKILLIGTFCDRCRKTTQPLVSAVRCALDSKEGHQAKEAAPKAFGATSL